MERGNDPDFIGWIPTASERLSFGLIGDSDFPEKAVTGYAKRGGRRFVVSYQRRETLDIPLPFRILRSFVAKVRHGETGRGWYVCVGSTPDDDTSDNRFKGFLYLFVGKSNWRKPEKAIQETQSCLQKLASNNNAEDLCKKIYSLQDSLTNHANYCVEFELVRTGVCKIWDRPAILGIGNRLKVENQDPEDVVAQLFFFLKEISHVHQHHHQHSDRIVELQRFDGEVSWRRETLCSLYRQSLRARRNCTQSVADSVKGILAYTKSFINICRSELDLEDFVKLPMRNHETLLVSIEAAERKSLATPVGRIFQVSKIGLVVFLPILISILGLGTFAEPEIKIALDESHYLRKAIEISLNQPGRLIAPFIVVVMVYGVVSGLVGWSRSDLIKKWLLWVWLILKENLQAFFFYCLSWSFHLAFIYFCC